MVFDMLVLGRKMHIFLELIGVNRLPLKIDTAIVGVLFYGLGFLFNQGKCIKEYENKWKNMLKLVFLCAISLNSYNNGMINICETIYNDFGDFIFYAIVGIGIVIIFSKILERNIILKYIGRNSLLIFSIHSFALYGYEAILSHLHGQRIKIMVNLSFFESIVGTLGIIIILLFLTQLINKFILTSTLYGRC